MTREPATGLVVVLTGDGKGKTTGALGMALRALGHGGRVAVVQFMKARPAGEHEAAERLAPDLEIHRAGEGFCRPGEETDPRHRRAAQEALALVARLLGDGKHAMVVADEVFEAVKARLLEADDVAALIADRPAHVHLVLTGREAPASIVAQADLVTEMRAVKHPHERGLPAQPGIEF